MSHAFVEKLFFTSLLLLHMGVPILNIIYSMERLCISQKGNNSFRYSLLGWSVVPC
jgi:hypothetical protein